MARNPDKKRCKARSKQRGGQCKNWAKIGHDVCRFHGAGGGAPKENKNAVTTGEHETIWMDCLDDDEQELMQLIKVDPVKQVEEEIKLLAIRERRMMQRIQELRNGMTEKQKRVLQQRKNKKDVIQVHDDKSGQSKLVPRMTDELMITEVEETEFRKIEDILKIEDALTRVQEKKLRAIELKHKMTSSADTEETRSWVEALKEVANRRRAVVKSDE